MIPEEITKFIGRTGDVGIFEMDKGAIRRYAGAIEDYNPLYWDEEYGKKSKYGSMIAPPWCFGWPTTPVQDHIRRSEVQEELATALIKGGYRRGVAGTNEAEFLQPIRPGDTLKGVVTIKDIAEKQGRTGEMLLVSYEVAYTNQNGELVAYERGTGIRWPNT